MAIKIVDLASEEAPSNDDYFVIRDNATGTTRKITRTKLFENPPIPAGAITHEMLGEGIIEAENLGESARPSVRVNSLTSTSTLTHNVDDYDITAISALAVPLTIAAPTGTPEDGRGFIFRIKDNGTGRAISFNAAFVAIGITLPTTTTAGKWLYIGGRYNATTAKYDILAINRQA